MSIKDKVTGKAKQVAGDLADEPSLRRRGRKEEQKGKKKEELERADKRAEEKADEVADLDALSPLRAAAGPEEEVDLVLLAQDQVLKQMFERLRSPFAAGRFDPLLQGLDRLALCLD